MVELSYQTHYDSCTYKTLDTKDSFSKKEGHCSCSIGNLIYTFGGVTQDENHDNITNETKDLNVYDTVTQKWSDPTTYGDIPSSRSAASIVAIGDSLYLFGGLNAQTGWSDELFKFNTKTGEWTELKHEFSPLARDKHNAIAINKDMYLFGGFGPTEDERTNVVESDSSNFTWFNDVFKYDTVKDTWILLSDHNTVGAPTPRAASSLSALKCPEVERPLLYVFGGRDRQRRQNDFFSFDPVSKVWKTITIENPPMARSFHATVTLNYERGLLALFGGRSIRDKHFADVHIYDQERNSWTKIKNSVCGRGLMTVTRVSTGEMIMIGGSSGFNSNAMSSDKIHADVYAITFESKLEEVEVTKDKIESKVEAVKEIKDTIEEDIGFMH